MSIYTAQSTSLSCTGSKQNKKHDSGFEIALMRVVSLYNIGTPYGTPKPGLTPKMQHYTLDIS